MPQIPFTFTKLVARWSNTKSSSGRTRSSQRPVVTTTVFIVHVRKGHYAQFFNLSPCRNVGKGGCLRLFRRNGIEIGKSDQFHEQSKPIFSQIGAQEIETALQCIVSPSFLSKNIKYKANQEGLGDNLPHPHSKRIINVDLELIEAYTEPIKRLELELVRSAKVHHFQSYYRLTTIPGVGSMISLRREGDVRREGDGGSIYHIAAVRVFRGRPTGRSVAQRPYLSAIFSVH